MAKEMWSLQYRLTNRRKKSVHSLIEHARFRAAYDFLCLRAGNDETLCELSQWWTDYQEADSEGRDSLLAKVNHSQKRKRRPKNKR